MFNILNLFSWKVWFILTIIIIFLFWLIYGGNQEYEFVGIKPLSTPKLFDVPVSYDYESPSIFTQPVNTKPIVTSQSNKGEDILAEALEEILSSPIQRNIRPDFLCNPETGKNMEIDCFNEEYAIAVEYNGIQHYKYPSVFYKTEKEFYNQVYRDRLKRKLCDENGIYLISVPYWVDMYDSHEQHIKETESNRKIAFVPREVRYRRIYDYLYKKISVYFQKIFPQEENEQAEIGNNRWTIYADI